MTGPSDDGQAGVAEADLALAKRVLWQGTVGGTEARVAAQFAAEREKARAPFLALAEELEREGRKEEAEAIRYGKAVTAESWWGSSAASLDAAERIRRAAKDGQP